MQSLELESLAVYSHAFKALGHPTRLQIFFFLVTKGEEGANVGEINACVDIPDATLSHHLDALRQAGLLFSTRRQRWMYYRVNNEMTRDLVRLLTACC